MTVGHGGNRVDAQDAAYKAWLGYTGYNALPEAAQYNYERFTEVVLEESSEVLDSAVGELTSGMSAMTGSQVVKASRPQARHFVAVGTIGGSELVRNLLAGEEPYDLELLLDGYALQTVWHEDRECLLLAASTHRGCLYAAFHLLRLMQTGRDLSSLRVRENPANPLRMIDHWDNMDGSIERGYAGRSIFFTENRFLPDLSRIVDYARLVASVGLNAISLNNVNVHSVETQLITDTFLPDVAKVAGIFRTYGIRTFLSVNFASPMEIGGLSTADPLDLEVRNWWSRMASHIYHEIPDFGGFLVKADSENRPGPFTYGRNHADGANMLAEAVEPYGGLVIWRCFVYDCQQDWRDRSTDRAKAAFNHFLPLDGRFHNNVMLQIKNGPMDFQVREPVSPLFGGLRETNQILELQITQEYTGQQRDLCYLVPQWKEVMDFDLWPDGQGTTVAKVVSGQLYKRPHGGMAAVSNVGDDLNWTGHLLAQANLFGFGRLAWDPSILVEAVTDEWVKMTFGMDTDVVRVVSDILLKSWRIYEDYTAPLGVGWMVNPSHHYGPNVDGYEYSKWGTYHFADCRGIGVDRTVKTGTGFAGQYHPNNAEVYESVDACPDELLLFFHHVPYTHRLHSGKTVIQHIYDTHFDGALQAAQLRDAWLSLQAKVDAKRFRSVLERFEVQIENAIEWRDVINTYFYRKSGIPDEHRRTIY